ncbi:MAG: DUF6179 domain-containing protein, partial [Clostridiales bacterium]
MKDKIINKINKKTQYEIMFINEAKKSGTLTDKEVTDIKLEIMYLLKDLVLQYTKGGSTSVKVEHAENLLRSIYYTLSLYINNYENNENKIDIVNKLSIKQIYNDGLDLIKNYVNMSKKTYSKILKTKLNINQEIYNTTIDNLNDFFKNYNYIFASHHATCDIDYPITFSDWDLEGINFIKQYIEMLDIENRFCNLFKIEDIINTLESFGQINNLDYKTTPYNIFEIIINNAIFSSILDKPANIRISQTEYEILIKRFYKVKTKNELYNLINKSFDCLKLLFENDISLINYIENYKDLFIER